MPRPDRRRSRSRRRRRGRRTTSPNRAHAQVAPAPWRSHRQLSGTSGVKKRPVDAAVAAGHPATTAAGVEILEDGGSAADAAVAASLASCVAETVMTGLLGGGHGIYWDAQRKRARNLDCFVAVPGLGAAGQTVDPVELE